MHSSLFTLAHVKWFTQVFPPEPEPLARVLTLPFWLALALSVTVALVAAYYNVPLQRLGWVERIHATLDRMRPWVPWIIRVGTGIPLIFAGFDSYLLHFELGPTPGWMAAAQVLVGTLVLLPWTDRIGGAALIALFVAGAAHFGLHPLLDYVSWLGAAYFLLSRGSRIEGPSIAILYITTGLSLSWAAIEKWVYPEMALDILAHHRIPTFGFPPDLFLLLAGFVELGVGYLLITGVLNRFLALVVTGLFVMTSSLFGLREVLGHWQLHSALLVFLAVGTGPLVTPVLWHRGRGLQLAFVGVTLLPFIAVLMALYYLLTPGL